MARCESCIHTNICNRVVGHGYAECPHYQSADVAPRAEVAREIFAEIEEIADTHYGTYSVLNTKDYFDLKKKYTEGQK